MRTTVDTTISQTPCFSLDSVITVDLHFGSTPPSLYSNGYFATDFCSATAFFFFLCSDGPLLITLSCYKVSEK